MNPILKWALQILLQPGDTSSVDESVSNALAIIGIRIDQIRVNDQPLHSIFSVIGENTSVSKKKIGWQVLDPQNIVYPTEDADNVTLDIRELEKNWERFPANKNLALTLIEKIWHISIHFTECATHLLLRCSQICGGDSRLPCV